MTMSLTMSLLTHCFLSASTLPLIYVRCYFEFLGKTIVQPRRDLFEKATGLSVSHSTRSCFLIRAESESAMATARQHDLIGTHIDAGYDPTLLAAVAKAMARTAAMVRREVQAVAAVQLRQLQPIRPSAPPLAPPSSSSAPQQQQQRRQQQQQLSAGGQAAPSATPGRQHSTLPAHDRGLGRGKGQ